MKNIKRNACIAAVIIGVMNVLFLDYLKIIHVNFDVIGTVAITIAAIIIWVGIIVIVAGNIDNDRK